MTSNPRRLAGCRQPMRGAWLLSLALAPGLAAAEQHQSLNLVSLSASASVDVTKDWLTVVFSTSREGPDAAVVQAQLRQALDAALAVARKAAKPSQLEVHTGAFSLVPRYATVSSRSASPAGGPSVVAWQGTVELIVEGHDAQAIAELTGRVQTLSIANVGFSLSREARERVEGQVTDQAIERFRTRADAVAKAFGFAGYTLGEVTLSSDLPGPVRLPMMQAMGARTSGSDALPVEAGKATVGVTVNGSVQLK